MKRLGPWLLLAGFALIIFGAKLTLIAFGATDLPFMDQWDGEAETAIRPWLEHRLDLGILLHPHNEHRIVTTKLYVLALVSANAQWSALLEIVGNAAIHTATAIVLLLLGRRWLSGRYLGGLALLLVATFTLPFSWENSLCGFQVQFYFLLLFSIAHIALVLSAERGSPSWWLGHACGLLAVLSLASGFLSSAAIIAVLISRLLGERRLSTGVLLNLSLPTILVAVGWLLKTTVPAHAFLQAHSLGDFFHSLWMLLAWPGTALLPLGLLPLALLLASRFLRSDRPSVDPVLLGLGVWIFLQCAALAYGRGGSDAVLSSRYLDLLVIHLVVGFILLQVVLTDRTRPLVGAAWLIAILGLLLYVGREQFRAAVEPNLVWHHQQEDNVRQFLLTGDAAILRDKDWPIIPYVSSTVLQQRLENADLRPLLPPIVQPGLPIANPVQTPPPELPADLARSTIPVAFSSFASANLPGLVWRTEPHSPSPRPLLRFHIAGDLGRPGAKLSLLVRSKAGAVAVEPDTAPGLRWKTITVAPPAGDWWLEATDADPQAWFAVTLPVEVGRGTQFAEKLLKHHLYFVFAGFGCLVLGGSLWLRPRPRPV